MATPKLFECAYPDKPWIYDIQNSLSITQGELLVLANVLSDTLPDKKYMMLLCENRKHFFVGFVAALLRGQQVFLPPNKTNSSLEQLKQEWSDIYCLVDETDNNLNIEQFKVDELSELKCKSLQLPEIKPGATVVTLFTSGSTGSPKPSEKTWEDMAASATRISAEFEITEKDHIVATVPPQHMFGFETSVLVPIFSGASIICSTPFYPEDVRTALSHSPSEPTLITTPMHLRAFEAVTSGWPSIRQTISATAPLAPRLADENETRLGGTIYEILGSTELGAIATRRTSKTDIWKMIEPLTLRSEGDHHLVLDSGRDKSERLDDRIEIVGQDRFKLLGRPDDLIKVAGKRASLTDLNLKLNSINGVIDGVFIQKPGPIEGVERLSAIVVAPDITDDQILRNLANWVDPVFLPRPIYRVDKLPRNSIGKVAKDDLENLLISLG